VDPREPTCQDLRSRGMAGGALDGSAGATPHSGRPFGLPMRFGSHSSSLAALSFYTQQKSDIRNEGGRTEGRKVGRKEELTKYSSRASNFLRLRSSPSSCSRLI
jgi:hypothetical protein